MAGLKRIETGRRRKQTTARAAKVLAGVLFPLVGGVLGGVWILKLDWSMALLSSVLLFSWPVPAATYLYEGKSVPYWLRPRP